MAVQLEMLTWRSRRTSWPRASRCYPSSGFSRRLLSARSKLTLRSSRSEEGSRFVLGVTGGGVGAISDEMMQNVSTTWRQFAIAS
jgi:hypothetical protein